MAKIKRIVVSETEGRDLSDRYGDNSYVYEENGAVAYYSTNGQMYRVMEPGKFYGAGNDSGDGNGLNTIKLIPVYDSGTDQYIIIDPTVPNHIHIRAGGTIDASNAELIIGGEQTNVTISDGPGAVFLNGTGGQYLNSFSSDNQIATIGDVGVETSYAVQGGTDGTQPTFDGDPLFNGNYIRMSSNLVYFEVQVDMDNITGFGTGQYYITLPFDAKYAYQFREGCIHDNSTGTQYQVSGHVAASSNQLLLSVSDKVGGAVQDVAFTSTVPFTLDTADNFHIAGTYIAEAL